MFEFGLVDTSLQGAIDGLSREERERLAWVGEEPRRRLAETGQLEVVDEAPPAGPMLRCEVSPVKPGPRDHWLGAKRVKLASQYKHWGAGRRHRQTPG
jgi:hypothetical protein